MTEAEEVGLDRLVDACIKIRERKAAITDELNTKLSALDEKLTKFKQVLNDHCEATGAESVRTASGTFYRSVKTKFWTSDWESMNEFIMQHKIHQTNMRTFLEENPDKLPPGLNADSEYTITVRRKK
jgi:hypothetical protein